MDARLNQISDMIQVFNPSYRTVRQFHLDEFQTYSFPGINNTTVPVKKVSRWYGWLTVEETSCKNTSINYFNNIVDNSNLHAEGNACGIIAVPRIESTFENDYTHVLHDLPKRYIYGYLISKLIISEATIHNIIWQTICLLLIWGDKKIEDRCWYLIVYRIVMKNKSSEWLD